MRPEDWLRIGHMLASYSIVLHEVDQLKALDQLSARHMI